MAIAPAPIQQNPENPQTGLAALAWVQWYQQVVSALASLNQDGSASFTGGNLSLTGTQLLLGPTNGNFYWIQPAAGGLLFNYWNGSAWTTAFQMASTTGAFTFAQPAALNFGSNWQSWTPAITASGSMTVSSLTIGEALYLQIGPVVYFKAYFNCTLGGSASNQVLVSLPTGAVANAVTSAATAYIGPAYTPGVGLVAPASGKLQILTAGLANYALTGYYFQVSGFYRAF